MEPLLDSKVFLRTKIGPGFTQGARARLYADHIEITNRRGELLLKATLRELHDVRSKDRMIAFTAQGRYFLLVFSSGRTVLFGFMGLIGKLLGAATDPTRNNAKTWVSVMQQNGVTFS